MALSGQTVSDVRGALLTGIYARIPTLLPQMRKKGGALKGWRACRSRLGCQVLAEKDLDGLRVRIPSATRNFAVDGHVPKPH